ncbi:MAG: ACR3 family arsenite efflux transporter [Alphaproteobacteria bacterium]|nr:ACR3 family arsenite efflux transporter [Alphaproteobacteria bacterium]
MPSPLGFFERYLSIWVGLSIAAGVLFGHLMPSAFQTIANIEYAHVNFVVAALIWVMIYPMMVAIDFSTIKDVSKNPKGLVITFIINWLIKPFSMAGLGVLFLQHAFAAFIPPEEAKQYVAGLILLGTAPCTAMVFVWSRLVKGNANYTLVQVSLNDIVMILAYAPIVAFLLGVSNVSVPWATLLLSVGLYVIIPIAAGYLTRKFLSPKKLYSLLDHLKPYSVLGLLATVVLLFGFQAQTLLDKPLVILLIAIPILLQSVLMFLLTYVWLCKVRVTHNIAAPAALIGASNFFELAVAVAISLFGLQSGAALSTVVGVLVEVPAMLWLVSIANKTAKRFALPVSRA